jgi:broad specificity phosphatase PhoE
MKIYILRHEDRTQDCSFFSPLTKQGLENATELIDVLDKQKINKIYSSPFIRTLQTVYPYVKEKNHLINIDYGLSELHHTDLIAKKSVGMSLPEYLGEAFCYNPEYKSIIKPTEIVYPETEENVNHRVKKFLRQLILLNYNSNDNIVLTTHQAVCFSLLRMVNKHSNEFKGKIDREILTNYPKGKLCLIFDGDWTYKLIN